MDAQQEVKRKRSQLRAAEEVLYSFHNRGT